ncbi:hypothetical protein H5410_009605 [Solanum commersonii]|uniref:CCHC-type domain-containing protein n=1 Tax=Solanum commersonii TaxID=4109 RepID=A0A9J6AJ87_SOLCO|nr:hypothetical protein H5410_009605 [Solanum commersonii]
MDLNKEPLTMMVNRRSSFKGKKLLDTACEHCGYRNHLSKDCYRIIGYPNDFKSKRKQGQDDSNTGYRGQSMAYGTENGHRSNNFSHNYHVDSGIKPHANYLWANWSQDFDVSEDFALIPMNPAVPLHNAVPHDVSNEVTNST